MRIFPGLTFFLIAIFWSLSFEVLASTESTSAEPTSAKSISSNASNLTPVSVQLNWNHQFQFAGFYAALQQGYYEQAGLDVTLKNWKTGTDIVDEVAEGRADFGIDKGVVLADYANGSPISLVMASFQFSP